MSQSPGLEAALKSVPMASGLAPTLRPGLKPTSPFSHTHFKGSYSFFFMWKVPTELPGLRFYLVLARKLEQFYIHLGAPRTKP